MTRKKSNKQAVNAIRKRWELTKAKQQNKKERLTKATEAAVQAKKSTPKKPNLLTKTQELEILKEKLERLEQENEEYKSNIQTLEKFHEKLIAKSEKLEATLHKMRLSTPRRSRETTVSYFYTSIIFSHLNQNPKTVMMMQKSKI